MTLRIQYQKLIEAFEDKVEELIEAEDAETIHGMQVVDISSENLLLKEITITHLNPRFAFSQTGGRFPLWGVYSVDFMDELIDVVDARIAKLREQEKAL